MAEEACRRGMELAGGQGKACGVRRPALMGSGHFLGDSFGGTRTSMDRQQHPN